MDFPVDLQAILVPIGAAALLWFTLASRGQRQFRSHRQWSKRSRVRDLGIVLPHVSGGPDAACQLRAVENASFGSKRLLRFEESKVFAAAEVAVCEAGMPWRVFAQVSLGEVLTCQDRGGFNAINAKRVDLLITDADFSPLAAIEYQGAGHHLSKAATRDAIKREALRKAGIGYIEITNDHGPMDVRREIGRLALRHARAAAQHLSKAVRI